ncbi:MAG: sigma-70 family RNA polymerase sigma factor, partial [Actinomyces sp.]
PDDLPPGALRSAPDVVAPRGARRRGDWGDADERDLVAAARHDVEAFAELYRRHVDAVYAFAWRRTGDRAAAEDVTASTFERALAGLRRYRWRDPGVGPWLLRIAANVIVDEARRRRRRAGDRARAARRRQAEDLGDDPFDRIVEQVDAQRRGDELRRALDSLPARYQTVLALRHLAGLEPAAVAAAVGVSRPTLAVLTHRATAALRRALADTDGGASTDTGDDPGPGSGEEAR